MDVASVAHRSKPSPTWIKRVLLLRPYLPQGYQGAGSLSLACLAAYIEDLCEVKIKSFVADQPHDIGRMVRDFEPDLVGITGYATSTVVAGLKLAKIIKTLWPELMIIMGGFGATFLAQEILEGGDVDVVARGEGELTLRELVQVGSPEGIQGLSYRCDDQFIHNADRPLIQNLDDAPFPAVHLLDLSEGVVHYVEMSRGCFSRCTFCACPKFHRYAVRAKSPARVVEEIKYILRWSDAPRFGTSDENVAQDSKWIAEICDLLIKENLSLEIMSQARADNIVECPELAHLMAQAGFKSVILGLESGSEQTLKEVRKGIKLSQSKEAVRLLKKNGLYTIGALMLGFPHETPEMMMMTADFALEAEVDVAGFAIVTPHPGTALYGQCKSQDLLLTEDWRLYDYQHQIIKTPGWPEVNVEAIQAQITKGFFFRSDWIQSQIAVPDTFRRIVTRGVWRTGYIGADHFDEWRQLVEGYAPHIAAYCSGDLAAYTQTIWFETELGEMTLQVEGGRPKLLAERVGKPGLVIETSNKLLNRLFGLMDIDMFSGCLLGEVKAQGTLDDVLRFIRWMDTVQAAIMVQWPLRPVDNPVFLPKLNCLAADHPRLRTVEDGKRQNILLRSEQGSLLVRLRGHEATDIKLLAPAEHPGGRIRHLREEPLEEAALDRILAGGLGYLVEILADAASRG